MATIIEKDSTQRKKELIVSQKLQYYQSRMYESDILDVINKDKDIDEYTADRLFKLLSQTQYSNLYNAFSTRKNKKQRDIKFFLNMLDANFVDVKTKLNIFNNHRRSLLKSTKDQDVLLKINDSLVFSDLEKESCIFNLDIIRETYQDYLRKVDAKIIINDTYLGEAGYFVGKYKLLNFQIHDFDLARNIVANNIKR